MERDDIFSRESFEETEQTIIGMLGYLGVQDLCITDYTDFIFGDVTSLTSDGQMAAKCLSRAYINSLNIYRGHEPYRFTEQAMMGMIFGRTTVDEPVPIKNAVQTYAGHANDSEFVAQDCVNALKTGINNLARRLPYINNPLGSPNKGRVRPTSGKGGVKSY